MVWGLGEGKREKSRRRMPGSLSKVDRHVFI
jgi:hypothetical protein